MKPGSEKSDAETSLSKNPFSKMSGWKTLQNQNLTIKLPAVNIPKKNNSKIAKSKKLDEQKSDKKNNQATETLLKNS